MLKTSGSAQGLTLTWEENSELLTAGSQKELPTHLCLLLRQPAELGMGLTLSPSVNWSCVPRSITRAQITSTRKQNF